MLFQNTLHLGLSLVVTIGSTGSIEPVDLLGLQDSRNLTFYIFKENKNEPNIGEGA